MTLQRPRLITFDVFGTLFQAEGVADPKVMQSVVGRNGLALTPEELGQLWWDRSSQIAFEDFVTVREATRMALASLLLEWGVDDDAEAHTRRLLEVWMKTDPYPETMEAVKALAEFDLGIVSNIDDDILRALLRRSRLTDRFRVVVTSEATRTYKPAPAIFQEALHQTGYTPGEGLHLGDSFGEDVIGATGAGMMAGWIRRHGEVPAAEGPEPDLTAADLREAANFILAAMRAP
ncbi:MAG: HAD family hydrolase [Thermoplasmata archaeon]